MSQSVLVENLQKSFKVRKKSGFLKGFLAPEYTTVQAVDGVSFSLKEGERVAFVGPNGAGKSTTIKMLSGILHPDSGYVEIGGFVPWTERKAMAYKIGTVFGQRSQLWYHLPAQDTFELLSYAYDMSRSDFEGRIKSLVDAFDARHIVAKPVRQLSLGERMRCEIIASLLHRPKILFLDEPTVGLDVVSKGVIRDLIKKASDEDGTTVLLTSHDTGDMERVCDRVIVIDHGRLVADKPIRDLRSGYIREKIITLAMKEEIISLTMKGVRLIEATPHQLRVSVDTSQISVEAVLQHAMKLSSLQDITVEDPPMEDIIKEIYAGSLL
ncbi:MAG: ATP-binding cassette domain-containing protein [Pseudobdellovibrionaceae bacterium]|jgi:ABC-2 type transport system ATP-binding protein|nr:ATP-binding cassette domain-containing protein [Pseudobdellovibrionaceae bacterium]